MKPTTEKPHDQIMRFFTPELFVQYNSSNDEEADRADEAWESAVQQYQARLAKLRASMPAQIKKLADLRLHDAEVLACDRVEASSSPLLFGSPAPGSGHAIVSVKQDDMIVTLIYELWSDLRKHQYEGDWPFSKQRPHWLYDEIDSTSQNSLMQQIRSSIDPMARARFLHRILFSDGVILEIPFESVLIHKVPMQAIDDPAWSKQIA